MIEKPTIIITSLGRTGTKFFAALFRDLIPNAISLHEPDVFNFFQYESKKERIRQTVKQIQEVGLYNLFSRRAFGSVIELSDSRMRNDFEYEEFARQLLKLRCEFVESREGTIYVESSIGYYGLIDVLSCVYECHRVVYVVRDGRDWARSHMNWGEMYGKGKLRSIFAHTWPTAPEIAEDPYADQWSKMSRFEKICWAWVRLNRYALDTIQQNPNARVFRFEDIFESEDRYQHLAELVNFATDMPGVDPVPAEALEGWLDRRIHKSSGDFPAWPEWSTQQKQQFKEICGSLMEELGYELN
ncbi:MAG: hypothetical protein ACP5HM_15595 [Anaerolineae bacterium]